MMRKRVVKRIITALLLLGSVITYTPGASAQLSGVEIDFAAAEPLTYNHATGGGSWGDGDVNSDIERSLEGEEFACGDNVSYLTKVSIGDTSELTAMGAMTLDLSYYFTLDTTGQSGVALGEPFTAVMNSVDSASSHDGGSSVATASIVYSGPVFTKGSNLIAKIRLTDAEAGETIIVRTDIRILCQAGASPTGNLQAKFDSAAMVFKLGNTAVNPAEPISGGEQTVPFQNLGNLAEPKLVLAKTVTTTGQACPGVEEITIEPDDVVRYCYLITNPSNSGGNIGAPVYNINSIQDDSGDYPDFEVTTISGLSDLDSDGQVDDLPAGATATAFYEIAFDGGKDTILINTATVTGNDAPTVGNLLTASDTAKIFIDAPEFVPAISIEKTTNGSDGPSLLVGLPITWSYLVSNTGNTSLTTVYVIDSKGVSVVCPSTTLAAGASMTCLATGVATLGDYSNIGTAYGTFDAETVTDSDSSSYFGAQPGVQVEKSPDSQVVEEGKSATFTITVTNTGNVALNDLAVADTLSPDCARTIGSLAIGETSTFSCTSPAITADLTNVAVVTAKWGDETVTDDDSGSVIVDYLPKISIVKGASVASLPETGGNVTFTISVKNEAPEVFSLTALNDDRFGNLNGVGDCVVPQLIASGATYSCSFVKFLASDNLVTHTNIATASGADPEQHPASASDDASVTFTDVLPDISMTKLANPTAALWTGGYIDYTFTITNLGLEPVTISSFVDDTFTLSAECLALVGQTLAPSQSKQCKLMDVLVSGLPGGSVINTATATANDNEGNSDTAIAKATVNFWWYGRTPGYWKNHPEAWISGYTPTMLIQDVFNIPAGLLSGSVLNIDKTSGADTLMNGLAYQGGSTLKGGAQILLRAAIAALLNKAYYGADYPIATSTLDLIAMVNNTLAFNDRTAYVMMGSYLDFWNNAVHAALP